MSRVPVNIVQGGVAAASRSRVKAAGTVPIPQQRQELAVLPLSPIVPDLSGANELAQLSSTLDQIPGVLLQAGGLIVAKNRRDNQELEERQRKAARAAATTAAEAEKLQKEQDQLDSQNGARLGQEVSADLLADIQQNDTALGFEIPISGSPSDAVKSIIAQITDDESFADKSPAFLQAFEDSLRPVLLSAITSSQLRRQNDQDKQTFTDAARSVAGATTVEQLQDITQGIHDASFRDVSLLEAKDFVISRGLAEAVKLGEAGRSRIEAIQKFADPRHEPQIADALRSLEQAARTDQIEPNKEFGGHVSRLSLLIKEGDLTEEGGRGILREEAEKLRKQGFVIPQGDVAAGESILRQAGAQATVLRRAEEVEALKQQTAQTAIGLSVQAVSADTKNFAKLGPVTLEDPGTRKTIEIMSPEELQRATYAALKAGILGQKNLTDEQKQQKLVSLLTQISAVDPQFEADAENAGISTRRVDLTADQVDEDLLNRTYVLWQAGILGKHVKNSDDLESLRTIFTYVNNGVATMTEAAVRVSAQTERANKEGRFPSVTLRLKGEGATDKALDILARLRYDENNLGEFLGDVETRMAYYDISAEQAFEQTELAWKEGRAQVNGNTFLVPRNLLIGKETVEVAAPWLVEHYLTNPNALFTEAKQITLDHNERTGQFSLAAVGGIQQGLTPMRWTSRDMLAVSDFAAVMASALEQELARGNLIRDAQRQVERSKRRDEFARKLLGLESIPKTKAGRKKINQMLADRIQHAAFGAVKRSPNEISPEHWSTIEVPESLSAITLVQLAEHRIEQDPNVSEDAKTVIRFMAIRSQMKTPEAPPVTAQQIFDDPIRAALQGTRN